MALSIPVLAELIAAELCPNPDPETGIDPVSKAVDNAAFQAFCEAIAKAVINHLITAGVVNVTVIGTASSTPPAAVTGTGTGTIN